MLSHIALAVPNPTKDNVKGIESIFFKFLWGNGSEKVRREDCKLPIRQGGLGMPDISQFWTAFKFSWLRRLLKTQAFWPKLLLHDISTVLNRTTTVTEVLQMGTAKIHDLSKNIKNLFWRQVLNSVGPVVEGSIFCSPGKLIDSSFWHNPFIKRSTIIKYANFPEISDKIRTLADFFYHGTNEFMQYNHFCERHSCNISEEKFIDIRYTIMSALQD